MHNFLSTKPKAKISGELSPDASVKKTISSLLKRVEYTLYHSLIWAIHVDVSEFYFTSPSAPPFATRGPLFCDKDIIGDPDDGVCLMAPIIVWYVFENCEVAIPPSFKRTLYDQIDSLRRRAIRALVEDFGTARLCILIWYFHESLYRLYRALRLTPHSIMFPEGHTMSTEEKDNSRRLEDYSSESAKIWQKRSEKAMAATRKHAVDSYSDEFEIVDRLAFLGIELGFVTTETQRQPTSCVYQARRRILDKTATKTINPGLSGPSLQNGINQVSIQAPWELSCLSHHSRLAATYWGQGDVEDEDVQRIRENYSHFFTANFTYVGSWNMSKVSPATWWDLDATCVIQATHLDLRTKAAAQGKEERDKEGVLRSPQRLPLHSASGSPVRQDEELLIPKPKRDGPVKRELPEDGVIELLKKQIAQQSQILQGLKTESNVTLAYDWIRSKPGPLLYPTEWVESLDDTPEVFNMAQPKSVQLRQNLFKYLVKQLKAERKQRKLERDFPSLEEAIDKIILQPSWSKATVAENFDISQLSYLTVANIRIDGNGWIASEVFGRLRIQQFVKVEGVLLDRHHRFTPLPFESASHGFKGHGPTPRDLSLGLWLEYLDGNLGNVPEFSGPNSNHIKARWNSLSIPEKAILQDKELRELVLHQYKIGLLDVLGDSVSTVQMFVSCCNLTFE